MFLFFGMFSKKVEKHCTNISYKKEEFNKKIKINFDSENESQLKRIRKPPLSMSEEKLLAKQIKKTVPV